MSPVRQPYLRRYAMRTTGAHIRRLSIRNAYRKRQDSACHPIRDPYTLIDSYQAGARRTMPEDYLSKDRERINALQRKRREHMTRIDYMPDRTAVAILQARRAQLRPGSPSVTNSALLDVIVREWAQLTGINNCEVDKPPTSGRLPEFSDTYARANDFGFCHPQKGQAKATGSMVRVTCGARRRRDGLPCQALSVPGKRRCKWHGGWSTGPKTRDGTRKALDNLIQNRHSPQSNQIVEAQTPLKISLGYDCCNKSLSRCKICTNQGD